MTRAARPRPPRTGDPYGVGPIGTVLAPVLSVIGLLLIGVITWNLLNGEVPFGVGGSTGDGGNVVGPARTAAPSNEVVVPEEAAFEGSIVYAKAGNIWVQTNEAAKQLTSSGGDSMPSWSPDGRSIFYIRSTNEDGFWPFKGGRPNHYALVGAGPHARPGRRQRRARAARDRVRQGRSAEVVGVDAPAGARTGWQDRSPSSRDAPNPADSNVVLQFFDTETKKLRARRRQGIGRARPPGPRVAARRPAPALHPERPRRVTRAPR